MGSRQFMWGSLAVHDGYMLFRCHSLGDTLYCGGLQVSQAAIHPQGVHTPQRETWPGPHHVLTYEAKEKAQGPTGEPDKMPQSPESETLLPLGGRQKSGKALT